MKIKGNEVIWKSEKENVAIAFSKFDMGKKYKVYHKVSYLPENFDTWEFVIAFDTMGEASDYAGKIYDEPALR